MAIYIRWSTDDQGDGTTAHVQLEGCTHYALSQGWQVRPELIFVDDGYSGGDLSRPALTRLRAAVTQGEVDCVLLFKLDRLSRNVVDTVNLVLREWEGRCHIKCAREAIDTGSPAGKMFFYTLVSFAEWERAVIRERTMSGKLKRLAEGKNFGFRPPFGLRVGPRPGSFAVNEPEAAIVRLIFERYLQGAGYSRIAADLTRQGLLNRQGRSFTARGIADILGNPIYAGQLVYGRRITNPRRHGEGPRQIANPLPPTVVAQTQVPPLICSEQFAAAEALRESRVKSRPPNRAASSPHLLTGLVRCRCGSALVGLRTASGPTYYVCAGKRTRGKQFCSAAHIRQEAVDRWLVERLLTRYGAWLRAGIATEGEFATEYQAVRAALMQTLRGLSTLDKEEQVVGRHYRQERLTLEEYQQHMAAITANRTDLEGQRRAHEAHLERPPVRVAQSVPLPALWHRLPHADQKQILRELVLELTLYRAPRSRTVEYRLRWVAPTAPV